MIAVINAHPRRRIPPEPVKHLVRKVLRGEKRGGGEINVVFTDHRRMRRLNTRFLRHRSTTDTLAFPMGESDRVEGEVVVNLDQAAAQAKQYGVTMSAEIRRLVIHATLHLCGFDDATPSEKGVMSRKEDRYLDIT